MKELTREMFEARAGGGGIVPVYREYLADMETPVSVLSRAVDEDVFLLESVASSETGGRYSFLGVNPYGIFTVENGMPYLEMHGERRALEFEGNPLNALRGIIGKTLAMIVNLEPRKMMGFESNGMIMSVRDGDKFRVVEFPDDIKPGADIS